MRGIFRPEARGHEKIAKRVIKASNEELSKVLNHCDVTNFYILIALNVILYKMGKNRPPLISFNEVITLTFVLSSSYGGYLIAKRVTTFSILNEEIYNGFTALCSLLFATSAIVYVRDKSNIINRSNDNDNEDLPPEELVFEYTLEHAEGKEYVPEDVMYARFHSDIIKTTWMDDSTFKDNEKLEMVILNEGLRNIGDVECLRVVNHCKRYHSHLHLLKFVKMPSATVV